MLLSIIIPTKDRKEMLGALLRQIENQSRFNKEYEVIVVDDASSTEISLSERLNIPHVKLKRNESTNGANISRKIGFEMSRGEYIHFHDSDDLLGHEWIDRIINIVREESVDMLITSRLVVNTELGQIKLSRPEKLARLSISAKKFARAQQFVNLIGPLGGVTFSRRVVEKFSFHEIAASQDWLMYDEALRMDPKIVLDPANYFISIKGGHSRISTNPMSRARGYISAAKYRFNGRRSRKFVARIYCAHGYRDLFPLINVKYIAAKRILCIALIKFAFLNIVR